MDGFGIEITVKGVSITVPHQVSEIGKVYAKDFLTAMLIIQHPMTIGGDVVEEAFKLEKMESDLKKLGSAYYGSPASHLVFQIRKVENKKND